MKILVLSGGGVKGAFQLGVLEELYLKDSTPYNAIFGVSTGALTAGVLAQGDTFSSQLLYLNKVVNLYLGIRKNSDIMKGGGNVFSKAWNLFRHGGIYDPSPLEKLIDKNINPDQLFISKTYLGVGVVSLHTGNYYIHSGVSYKIRDSILSSASQPIFFQINSSLVDGGVRNITPIGDAIDWAKENMGDQEEVIIDVITTTPISPLIPIEINIKDPIKVLSRTFEIIMNEAFISDLFDATKKNKEITNGKGEDDDILVQLNYYHPTQHLGNGLEFEPNRIRAMMEHGREVGSE